VLLASRSSFGGPPRPSSDTGITACRLLDNLVITCNIHRSTWRHHVGRRREEVEMSRLLTSCAALLALCALPIGVAAAQEKVTVWWAKGFYESEDQALNDAIAKFEDETGIEVELSLFGGDDGLIKAVSAIEAGSPPDVGYSHTYDFRATNLWAYEGKLDAVDD